MKFSSLGEMTFEFEEAVILNDSGYTVSSVHQWLKVQIKHQ